MMTIMIWIAYFVAAANGDTQSTSLSPSASEPWETQNIAIAFGSSCEASNTKWYLDTNGQNPIEDWGIEVNLGNIYSLSTELNTISLEVDGTRVHDEGDMFLGFGDGNKWISFMMDSDGAVSNLDSPHQLGLQIYPPCGGSLATGDISDILVGSDEYHSDPRYAVRDALAGGNLENWEQLKYGGYDGAIHNGNNWPVTFTIINNPESNEVTFKFSGTRVDVKCVYNDFFADTDFVFGMLPDPNTGDDDENDNFYINSITVTTESIDPTADPTNDPTTAPTNNPTPAPTNNPTAAPTNSPTNHPTPAPTNNPTTAPTNSPTDNPTSAPTNNPTAAPTNSPTNDPTAAPTNDPTTAPTNSPTNDPTPAPTNNPTPAPTNGPEPANDLCDVSEWNEVHSTSDWTFDSSDCSLRQDDSTVDVAVWFGSADGATPNNNYVDDSFDLTVSLTIHSGLTAGILFRSETVEDNIREGPGYYLLLRPQTDHIFLVAMGNGGSLGTVTNWASLPIEYDTLYTLTVHGRGSIYDIYLDGDLIFDGIARSEFSGGSIGLRTKKSTATFHAVEYEYSDATPAPTVLVPLEWLGWSPEGPLEECQGDCDYDSDCASGLECVYNQIPVGCTGTMYHSSADYCGDVSVNAAAVAADTDNDFDGSDPSGARAAADSTPLVFGAIIGAIALMFVAVLSVVLRRWRKRVPTEKESVTEMSTVVHVPEASATSANGVETV